MSLLSRLIKKPVQPDTSKHAAKLANSILADFLPQYHNLFEDNLITPAMIKSALETYRTDGKVQDLSNLFDLFLDSDDGLQSAVDVRKAALKRSVWSFDETLPQDKRDFYDTLLKRNISSWIDVFIEGKLYGWQFQQIMWQMIDNKYLPTELVGYSNLDLRIEKRRIVLYEKNKPLELPEQKFISILYKRPKLHSILKYYIFYGVAINNWAQFTETYGKPLRLGTYDPSVDSKDLEVLKAAVKALGSDQAAIVSQNTAIEFKDFAGKSDSKDLYHVLCNFVSDRITKAILGQTLTTGNGDGTGSYALGQVHNLVRQDIQMEDLADFQNFIDILMGYVDAVNFGTGISIWLSLPKPVELDKRIAIDTALHNLGLPMTDDYFYDTYDVDRPQKGQNVLTRTTVAPAEPEANAEIIPDVFVNAEADTPIAKSLAKLQSEIRSLSSISELKKYRPRWFIQEFAKSLAEEAVNSYVSGRKAKSRANALPKIVFEFDETGIEAINQFRNQSMIISGVRTMAQLNELQAEAAGVLEAGGSFVEFIKAAALKGFEPANPYHLKTEFETARIAARASARWDNIQETKDIFPYLKYVTMRDDLVRDEHVALDGIVAKVDDPFWAENYPPNGWNCRCDVEELTSSEAEAEPRFEDRNTPEDATDPDFKKNPSEHKLPGGAEKDYAKYLEKVLAALSDAPESIYTNADVAKVTDKMGYPIIQNEYKVADILANPNEIWQQNGRSTYIKKSQDTVSVVMVSKGRVMYLDSYPIATYANEGRKGYNEYGL